MNPPDPFPYPRGQPLPSELSSALARAAERLGPFARQVQWYAQLSSTNDLAADYAGRGAREGALILAETQTAGRGRLGRSWFSPPGAGLYVSTVLRPEPAVVPLLTIAAGVAVAEGIREATGLVTALKWPNDVYAGAAPGRPGAGRKVAGILAEAGTSPAGAAHVVLGIGVNMRPAAYPPEIADRATSIEDELGRAVDRGAVLVELLAALSSRYDDLKRGRSAGVLLAWRAYAEPLLGRDVEWDEPRGTQRGVAEDVDSAGALLVRTEGGVRRVVSGEVRWM